MKILPLTSLVVKHNPNNKQNITCPVLNATEQTGSNGMVYAYRDYNINFTGRTPENFYAQKFNRDNMPKTMQDYLDYDYESRHHIPPEQMMREVFKYIIIADNFTDVKSIYPNEDLFKNLHDNKINSRRGILSEIKAARELSDAPLLKNGSDDFGMYLLRKIYLEGKTLKEISKDFLENDINDEYKGVITEPVQYATLDAYGIQYPKLPFWKSFIATRDEYKKFFVTLPKNSVTPGVNVPPRSGSSSGTDSATQTGNANKPPKRRHTLNSDRKKQIEKDIITTGGDQTEIERTVVKRFRKDDPEASFIVKYMSPIMTIAADKIHLSEEMRYFTEEENEKGKIGTDKYMFKRFWKANPYLLEMYSKSITDTIEMFEDVYGGGGNLPINKDFVVITPKVENQKPIDYVTQEFVDLLHYSKTIEPKRNARYAMHDELQKQWEEHFRQRYGDIEEAAAEEIPVEPSQPDKPAGLSLEEELKLKAAANNAQVYSFIRKDGVKIYITANLDEVWLTELKNLSKFFPRQYAKKFIRELSKEGEISDKLKLSIAVNRSGQEIEDPRIFSGEEFENEYYNSIMTFHIKNKREAMAASFAVADALREASSSYIDTSIYNMRIFDYEFMEKYSKENNNTEISEFMKNAIPRADVLYEQYCKPLSNSEINKIALQLNDTVRRFDSSNTVIDDTDVKAVVEMISEMSKYKKARDKVRGFFKLSLPCYPYSRAMLQNCKDNQATQAKGEVILSEIVKMYVYAINDAPYLMTLINRSAYDKYKSLLSHDQRCCFENAIRNMDYSARRMFNATDEELKRFDEN